MAKHSQLKDSGYWSNVINHQDLTLCCLYKIRFKYKHEFIDIYKNIKSFYITQKPKSEWYIKQELKGCKGKGLF